MYLLNQASTKLKYNIPHYEVINTIISLPFRTLWSKFRPGIIGNGPVIHLPTQLIDNPEYAEKLENTPFDLAPAWFQNWKIFQRLMAGRLDFNQPIAKEMPMTLADIKFTDKLTLLSDQTVTDKK